MDHAASRLSGDSHLQYASDAATGNVGGLAGFWKLAAGRALTIRAHEAGELTISHGRVWATFDGAADDLAVRAGDYFLSRGESLSLAAGQSLVIESFSAGHAASAYFSWEPAHSRVADAVLTARGGWRAGVLQPLADLRAASGLGASALGRLALGLVLSVAALGEALLSRFAMVFVAARGSRARV